MHDPQDADFPPSVERRRSLYEILPSEPDDLIPTSGHRAMMVSWLAIALTVTGTQTYRAYFSNPIIPKIQDKASYRWAGFHRIAP